MILWRCTPPIRPTVVPVGDGADGASVDRGGRAGPVRRPQPDPAPRHAPHLVGRHARRSVRQMHAAATRKLVAPSAGESPACSRRAGSTIPTPGWRRPASRSWPICATHGPSTARESGPAGPGPPAAAAAGPRHAVAGDGLGPHPGADAARLRGRDLPRPADRQLDQRCLPVRRGRHLAARRPRRPGRARRGRQLARRWLRSFGPATTTDLQWWMGWTVADTKRALADAGPGGRSRRRCRLAGRG